MNYYKLRHIKYKNNVISVILLVIIFIILLLLIIIKGYSSFITYASYTENYFIVPVKLKNSDIIKDSTMLKLDDKLYKFNIESVSELYVENYTNYQDYQISINKKYKNNEVKKITFYYKKERMIKKILKLIL